MGPSKEDKRLDQAMVKKGIAESRNRAQALVLAGNVRVNGEKVYRPGKKYRLTQLLRLTVNDDGPAEVPISSSKPWMCSPSTLRGKYASISELLQVGSPMCFSIAGSKRCTVSMSVTDN